MDWKEFGKKAMDIGSDMLISGTYSAERTERLSREDKQKLSDFRKSLQEQKEVRAGDNVEYCENVDDFEYYDNQDLEADEYQEEIYSYNGSGAVYTQLVDRECRNEGYFENVLEREYNRPKTFGKYVGGKKPCCVISTIGHEGHGKTTLTAAITKVLHKRLKTCREVTYEQINKVPEERKQGFSVSTTVVEYETYNRHYVHIDCPTHVDYVKNMIANDVRIHAAILVVSATNGVSIQTWAHIYLSHAIGIPYVVVFINHCDMIDDPELCELIDMEIRELLNEYDFPGDDTPIIQGSALKALEDPDSEWGDKILELMDAVDCWIPDPLWILDQPFLMSTEDVFYIAGRGTVATGKVERGSLRLNQEVEILANSCKNIRKVVVTCIEVYHKLIDEAWAGDNVGLLLRGVPMHEIERGFCLCAPGSVRCHYKFVALCYFFDKDEGGKKESLSNNYRTMFSFRTAQVIGVCKLPESIELVMPGVDVEMMIELVHPVAMEQGILFEIREGDNMVGRGKVVSIIQ